MKLGSIQGGRDGELIVVARDLSRFAPARSAVLTLQQALDDWDNVEPRLRQLSDQLNSDAGFGQPLNMAALAAPLPRAFQWADGSAYVNHVELVRRARGAVLPDSFWVDPLMYQGGSDDLRAAASDLAIVDPEWGYDIEAEVVVVTGDVRLGASRTEALEAVRLIGLINDVSLRNLIPGELAKGFGFVQSKPASALSPVLVTPDELDGDWAEGKLQRTLNVDLCGRPFGRAECGVDMTFDFGTLIAHLAKTRQIGAGSIIGSGTVSNRGADGGPGLPIDRGGLGYSCIAEARMVETILDGAPSTPFLKPGDDIRIWIEDADGASTFGDIRQQVVAPA